MTANSNMSIAGTFRRFWMWRRGNSPHSWQHAGRPFARCHAESNRCNLHTGDRLILVTDGVTEAENAEGEFFDNERLEAVAARYEKLQDIFSAVTEFCAGTPLNDDCTVVELRYTGQG